MASTSRFHLGTFGSLLALTLIVPFASATPLRDAVGPFVTAHCVKCHGPDKQEGDLALDRLAGDPSSERLVWSLILEQVESGQMPPRKSPKPPPAELAKFTDALKAALNLTKTEAKGSQVALPRDGNLVPHEALFGPTTGPAAAAPARLWRLRPEAYRGFVNDVFNGRVNGITQPFSTVAERGFKDFADLYQLDGATTEILVRNAEQIVAAQTASETKDGKTSFKGAGEFKALFDPTREPTPAEVETALKAQFRFALARQPTAEELASLVELHQRNLKIADRFAATRTTLAAVLLRPDVVFRMELAGQPDAATPRRPLSPRELAQAISLALGDRRDNALFSAADKGGLSTRDDVAKHVRRILDDPKNDKPRVLKFFREYFEYDLATEVFKDNPRDLMHKPSLLVSDTDRLVQHVLEQDRNVLAELLTTTKTFANFALKEDKKTRTKVPKPAEVPNPHNDKGRRGPEGAYNFDAWPEQQPAEVPAGQRAGILTQPSWLVGHSTNFDNDPVRRGRWVRERLLGGYVPQLPIGVVAQVPDDRHRTLRDRLSVTRAAECWRCHRKMDDLGLAFEQHDHFGRWRSAEQVLDVEATAKNVDKKGKPLGPVYRDAPLDASGVLASSGDANIDGPVANAVELMNKLAKSDRVRQVFVRHAFRFFMGRNETIGDAATLQGADKAYVESNGSFKALVTSLLTSDAFLFRATKSTQGSEQP